MKKHQYSIAMTAICILFGIIIGVQYNTVQKQKVSTENQRLSEAATAMKQLQEEKGTAVMMITHNLGVVAQFCTRLYVMYAGKVMESGTVKEIFGHVCHPYTDGLMRSVPDMESRERLYNIRGMVPNMLHLPKGCRFCPRCQYSGPRCFEEEPELYEAAPGHFVRCFLFESEGRR